MEQITWTMANDWMAGQLRADAIWTISFLFLSIASAYLLRKFYLQLSTVEDVYDDGVILGIVIFVLTVAFLAFFLAAIYNLTDLAANWGNSGHLLETKWYDPKKG